jgi:asparagine synthase (glutamine-hydrolysing)
MCGFVGSFGCNSMHTDLHRVTHEMLGVLTHRGPDDEGVWIEENCLLALGHKRLSVTSRGAGFSDRVLEGD